MLAHQSKRLDVISGSSHHVPPKELDVRPTAFMFIDASNGGVNAKPNKIVRSFVMKSARNKKPWSTKPKSPVSETPIEARSLQRPPCQPAGSQEPAQTSDDSPHLECDTTRASYDQQIVPSPNSRSASVVSSQNSDWVYESPVSSYTSPRAEYDRINFTCGLGQQADVIYQSGPNTSFAVSFNCLAVRLDAYTEGLIRQFVKFTTPNLLPIDLHGSSRAAATYWVASCLQSPIGAPFIYAALTTSTRAAKLDSDVYKWHAVSAVNKLLCNKEYSIDDTTIASVLILLALEESDLADPQKNDDRRSSIDANDAHLNGLRTMIDQRGGLASLGGNRCLQVCILMHSIAQSITTFKRPYAILYDANGRIEEYSTASLRSVVKPTHIIRQCQDLGVTNVLLDIVRTITIFISDLTVFYDTGSCPVDPLELQKHASLLMYRLFDWYDRCRQYDAHAIDQSICLALLIFMTHATEPKYAPLGSRLAKVVTKLHATLQKVPSSRWSNAWDLYLWTLSMGALGVQRPAELGMSSNAKILVVFFVRKFAIAFGSTHVDAAAAAHKVGKLHSCLWIPSVFDGRLMSFWRMTDSWNTSLSDRSNTNSTESRDHLVSDDYALGQSTTVRFFTNTTESGGD